MYVTFNVSPIVRPKNNCWTFIFIFHENN